MKRKVFVPLALSVMAALVTTVAIVASRPEPRDAHVVRAKEFLSVNELGAAASELKIALKKRPDSEEAKALLLYTKGRAEDDGVSTMFSIYPVLSVLASPEQKKTLDPTMQSDWEESAKRIRALLYEEGIDTRDVGELAAIIRRAARYAIDEAADAPDADYAAYALASDGDDEALAHLCERLKSDKAADVPVLLEKLGPPVVEPLRAIVADRQHLGRARAIEVLSRVLARELAAEFFAREPNLRGLELGDLPEPLRGLAGDMLVSRYVGGLTRQLLSQAVLVDLGTDAPGQLTSLYAPIAEDRGVLALQGYDPKGQRVLIRLYVFDGTRYDPAELIDGGKVTFASRPIARLRPLGPDRVELAFLAVTGVPEERRVPRTSFRSGDRVVLRKGSASGTVRGTDEYGLIRVHLDEPVQGMSNVELAPEMLLGLETITVDKPGYELREARLSGRRLELGPATSVASLAPGLTTDEGDD